jgi:DNA-binding MarR family transcriptional regulator
MSAWLGVVSNAHVQRGVAGGFAQLCHGKAQPLRRMKAGDWLVYYSPSVEMGGEPLKAFTAVGQVVDEEVFKFDMGGGFIPYRRRVQYEKRAQQVELERLKPELELCARPNWGIALRRGHLPLSDHDFALIAARMGVPHVGAGKASRPWKGKGDAPLPTRFAGPRDSPGFLLWRLSNAWQRRQRAALQPFGLTHSQFVLLATATWFGSKERLSQSRLSQLTGVDPMTTSQIVRALQAAGLMHREDDPHDPRAKALEVTEAGRRKAKEAISAVEQTDATFFKPVAEHVDRLVTLFQALVEAQPD